MTGLQDTLAPNPTDPRQSHRLQLSAMMDGALSADEAKFLLRRMEHDDELADCWERWQFFGDALRGDAGRALPADFSRRVGRAIAEDITAAQLQDAVVATPGTRSPLLRWGGGAALAASVALAALIGTRTVSRVDEPLSDMVNASSTRVEPVLAAGSFLPISGPMPGADTGPAPAAPAGRSAMEAGLAAATVAAASLGDRRGGHPRILARAQAVPVSARASLRATRGASAPARTGHEAAATALASSGAALAPEAQIVSKPWPRALVPGANGAGAVTAGYAEGGEARHVFRPRAEPLHALPAPFPATADAVGATP